MDWDDEKSEVPTSDEVTTDPPPAKTITMSKVQWRFAKGFSALVLILAIGGAGFILGHDVVTPKPLRSAAPGFTYPSFPSGGFGNGGFSPSFQYPTVSPQNTKAQAATAKIASKVDPGLVDITTSYAGASGSAEGTGMILTSNGLVLTNNHVVEGASSLSVRDIATNTTYVGTVVGYDLNQDVALIQLKNASGLTTIKTANSDKVTPGEKIVGIGNAGGLGGTPSYVAGSVVALNQGITAGDETNPTGSEHLSGLIEVNAAIEPGDSGGPLVNDKGKVVGMDTAGSDLNGGFGYQSNGTSTNRGYAIPINTALSIVSSIREDNAVSGVHIGATAFLGVEFASATSTGGGANASGGVTIAGTVPGTPAAQAGLVAGDTITEIAGQPVTSGSGLQSILLTKKPGDTIEVTFVNTSGTSETVSVTLQSGPAQ
ncbi:MAG TPA: trypsin-like peptidase domain-containing protein [Acidimicrobiales bacterium]|nr:trypsin-like peptidase domain-containing protein [Acidimicrobiales bacterium]